MGLVMLQVALGSDSWWGSMGKGQSRRVACPPTSPSFFSLPVGSSSSLPSPSVVRKGLSLFPALLELRKWAWLERSP